MLENPWQEQPHAAAEPTHPSMGVCAELGLVLLTSTRINGIVGSLVSGMRMWSSPRVSASMRALFAMMRWWRKRLDEEEVR